METDTENQPNITENLQSPFKIQSMPGTPQPLQQISPERQNQQRLPQSPSIPLSLDQSPSPRKSHQHRMSDASEVKARIAHLNALSNTGSPTRSPTKSHSSTANHAAIQRAILGREEAEAALNAFTAQLDSAKARERLVSERVESLVEQLTELRSRQRHERTIYEKEIRLSKKTEYKAELAVIKLQEDLREVRNELDGYKARSEHEKAEKEKARQEAFERAYAVAGMTEELQDVKQRLEVAEQERDAAVAMAASKISVEEDKETSKVVRREHETGDKRKAPMPDFDIRYYDELDLQHPDCPIEIKYDAAQKENDFLRRELLKDQETIHFMNMQCQFKACPCRLAERDGVRFVHDYEYDAKLRERNAKKRRLEGLEPEPEIPLPVYKSWLRERAEVKGKEVIRPQNEFNLERAYHEMETEAKPPSNVLSQTPEANVSESAIPLPPGDIKLEKNDIVKHGAILAEAANIPLPSLKPLEIDPSDETPEPTAQLEELTQVIVETGDSARSFMFSTSVMNNRAEQDFASIHEQSRGAVRMSDDLFDISPPKRHMPPRPSTAMGVLSVESPIRLVANSPQGMQRALTPDTYLPGPLTQSKTTRVALNDTSPVRQSRQQRTQSRPPPRDHSRGRSPAPQRGNDLERESPAPSTLFSIAPVVKHERPHIDHLQGQSRPQSTQGHYVNTLKEVSTTTTIPLRDEFEESPVDAHTAPLPSTGSASTPFSVPGTPSMTREAALAQIRARRDRARSINMRKSAEEGSKTPGSSARRGVNLNLKDRLANNEGKGRDFSQASAPGRI